ncbi:efflux RND transporter periplasmic adaptor subunit [Microbulbifer harenosus]|uniref:Efflux RND transporter periplasmic adaptor subunit n=1 Tax=Microbulbifer harenosus TaxID=2576840 RepID=A0ABY2UEP5_9GAMM|nr:MULTISPECIES: efflux RND transporter periplasmic adaptor subunit [Microbulbifer]QIL90698.1 efflux RND transporter periplasmic adaptor subunit [Microbulbifer sp. SH-1]TLM75726.1 efflux RND transporter periplasmic adaptor subunit [Microbulbifer harenosus]
MAKTTSELLDQLKIDRDAPAEHSGVKPRTALAIGVGFALTGLLAGLLFAGDGATGTQTVTPPAEPSSAASPARLDLPPPADSASPEAILNASGYITARRMATVSAEVMGLITSVEVEEGMRVEQGQVLATLDAAVAAVNRDFARAQVKVLEARAAGIEANLAEGRRQLVRYAGLIDRNYSSHAELSQAEANVASLQASLVSAQADIEVAQLEVRRQQERLNDHTIRAPFAGVVTQKNAQPGEIVAPSSAGGGHTRTGICTIVDMESLEIEVDVNEAFIGRVEAGQKVRANLDAYPDWDIPATVIAIIPTADRAKATVQVRIGIDSKDSRILPDMGVKVAFLRNE